MYFLLLSATYTMVFVADLMQIGLYSALPSLIGVFGMILIGRHSDKHGERRWHFAASVTLAAIGLGVTTLTRSACQYRRRVFRAPRSLRVRWLSRDASVRESAPPGSGLSDCQPRRTR